MNNLLADGLPPYEFVQNFSDIHIIQRLKHVDMSPKFPYNSGVIPNYDEIISLKILNNGEQSNGSSTLVE